MKINGIKVGFNIDVGEFDIDLKDVLDIQRLNYEHSRELRKAFKEERQVIKTPSRETKDFVEALVNKAIRSIKDQIVEAIKHPCKPAKEDEVDPDRRIGD